MSDRDTAHGPETEFEPGSRGRVLRNRLGIVSVRDDGAPGRVPARQQA